MDRRPRPALTVPARAATARQGAALPLLVVPLLLVTLLSACASGSIGSSSATGAGTGSTSGSGTWVTLLRTGGLAGVRDEVTVTRDGSTRVSRRSGAAVEDRLSATQLRGLRVAVSALSASRAPEASPTPVADGYVYRVTVDGTTRTYVDGSLPPVAQVVVDQLAGLVTAQG